MLGFTRCKCFRSKEQVVLVYLFNPLSQASIFRLFDRIYLPGTQGRLSGGDITTCDSVEASPFQNPRLDTSLCLTPSVSCFSSLCSSCFRHFSLNPNAFYRKLPFSILVCFKFYKLHCCRLSAAYLRLQLDFARVARYQSS